MSNLYILKIIDNANFKQEKHFVFPTRGACTAWLREKGYTKSTYCKNDWYYYNNRGQDKDAEIIKAKAIQ